MTVLVSPNLYRQPAVKRLGFEDGWWFFWPHFLNLKLPFVFVDSSLLSNPQGLGLESFGTLDPRQPLPQVNLHIGVLGNTVNVYTNAPRPQLLVEHNFRRLELTQFLNGVPNVGLIAGDSYAVQLSWSELWRCGIGIASGPAAHSDKRLLQDTSAPQPH